MVLTRRALVTGSAGLTAWATLSAAGARVAPLGRQAPGLYRYAVGTIEITALYDGIWHRPIDEGFVPNVPLSELRQAMRDAFMPLTDTLPFSMTVLAVNTGDKLVLLDSGTGGQLGPATGWLPSNLAAAGLDPRAVDLVAISHFHPDHINGLADKDGAAVFPNAQILVPGAEWDFWMDDGAMSRAPAHLQTTFRNARRVMGAVAGAVTRFAPGADIAPGIASIPAPGHTAGHTVFVVTSGTQSLLVLGDTTNHPALFARHPHWQPVIDVDGSKAVVTRRRLLDRAAADRLLVTGYHFPFPACGHILARGAGYDFVPVMWQPTP